MEAIPASVEAVRKSSWISKSRQKFAILQYFIADSLHRIHAEFNKYARFGLGLAMDILPISTCSADQAPDLYVLPKEDTSNSAPELNVPPNELCRQKMREIVVDLVDNGLL